MAASRERLYLIERSHHHMTVSFLMTFSIEPGLVPHFLDTGWLNTKLFITNGCPLAVCLGLDTTSDSHFLGGLGETGLISFNDEYQGGISTSDSESAVVTDAEGR